MKKSLTGLSSFSLHILAMSLMLCDHLWATLFPWEEWLTCIGRIAFPLFAFLISEGFYRTSNVKKYMLRMLAFAVISEIPFNLIFGSSVIYPFHQNVLWTFLIALLTICAIEKIKAWKRWYLSYPAIFLLLVFVYLFGTIAMVDYLGAGVLTVLVFYFFHEKKWWCILGQLVCMWYLNIDVLGGYYYPIVIAGHEFGLVQQGFALFALPLIWLYNGKQGYHAKWFRYVCYGFYPVHLLLLFLIWQIVV